VRRVNSAFVAGGVIEYLLGWALNSFSIGCMADKEVDCNTYMRIYDKNLQRIFGSLLSMYSYRRVLLVV
jgi:hypothetical protein